MITKETAIKKYEECRKAFEESGAPKDGQDAYISGFLNGVDAVKSMLQDESITVFPGYGTDVYKFVWIRQNRRGYFNKLKEQRSLISCLATLKSALKAGEIVIERRPFSRADLLALGTYCFETREEAEAALKKYKKEI